jgi:hypothetical protein
VTKFSKVPAYHPDYGSLACVFTLIIRAWNSNCCFDHFKSLRRVSVTRLITDYSLFMDGLLEYLGAEIFTKISPTHCTTLSRSKQIKKTNPMLSVGPRRYQKLVVAFFL